MKLGKYREISVVVAAVMVKHCHTMQPWIDTVNLSTVACWTSHAIFVSEKVRNQLLEYVGSKHRFCKYCQRIQVKIEEEKKHDAITYSADHGAKNL